MRRRPQDGSGSPQGRALGQGGLGQKLLSEAVADGETGRASLGEMTKRHRVVFVLHREDLTGTLETFAGEKDRLVNVVPGKGDYGSGKGIDGIRGSWLVFETPDQEEQPHQR